VYTSKLVDEEGAHMGVLGVNWDDEQTVDMSLDLVELGIATSIKVAIGRRECFLN
jgi:hypothetical protein